FLDPSPSSSTTAAIEPDSASARTVPGGVNCATRLPVVAARISTGVPGGAGGGAEGLESCVAATCWGAGNSAIRFPETASLVAPGTRPGNCVIPVVPVTRNTPFDREGCSASSEQSFGSTHW